MPPPAGLWPDAGGAAGSGTAACERPRVYFLGSGSIAVPVLTALAANAQVHLVGVGTQPDRPRGRHLAPQPTPVGQWCAQRGLVADKPESVNDPVYGQRLAALQVDLIVVFSFGQILSKALLGLPRLGCVNVHASLLPKYRGASPVAAAILAADAETGITFLRMVRQLDAGPVYAQAALALTGREDTPALEARLGALAAERIGGVLEDLYRGRLVPCPQDPAQVTYAPKLTRVDGGIDWLLPAAAIERRVRAYHPWPGAHGWLRLAKGRRQFTITAAAVEPHPPTVPGTVVQADKHAWKIACGQDALNVLRLVPEGKREMTGPEFIRGCPLAEGSVVVA